MTKEMSVDEYNRFRQMLEKSSGIMLGEGKEYLVTSRLRRMMERESVASISDLLVAMERNRSLQESVIDPFADFFSRFGWKQAALILLFAGCYRLTDFTMGVMANPFYIDVGYTLKEIAAVAKGFGLFMSLLGVFIGGVAVARLGTHRALVVGIILVILSNLSFASLAFITDPGWAGLATVISADNLAMGVAGTALIAYLTSSVSICRTGLALAIAPLSKIKFLSCIAASVLSAVFST